MDTAVYWHPVNSILSVARARPVRLLIHGERFKIFPPGLGHLRVPTSSRGAAMAGLTVYAACRDSRIRMQSAVWHATRILGTKAVPGVGRPWSPPLSETGLEAFREEWAEAGATFDTVTFRHRLQASRHGLMLLLIRDGMPSGFVKMSTGTSNIMTEFECLELVAARPLRHFGAPRPLRAGTIGEWTYSLVSPLPPFVHRPAPAPPITLIAAEIDEILGSRARPEGLPAHWRPMHGDFTPWNLRLLHDGSLVLYDWEDASWGPPGADEVLYLATNSAIRNETPGRHRAVEAVDFWLDELARRDTVNPRDRKLSIALWRSLTAMHAGTGPRAVRNRSALPARTSLPRLVVFAYAAEPRRGSEPGAGWGLLQAMRNFAHCTVLVGPEHTEGLRRWQQEQISGDINLDFIEVAEPEGAVLAKMHRLTWFGLYLFWLERAYARARSIHRDTPFDMAMHITYAAYWLPTPATRMGIPSVWGPVGGGVSTPPRLWPLLGWRGIIGEMMDLVSVRLASMWPSTRRAWRQSTIRIVQNDSTLDRLPQDIQGDALLLNHVLFIEPPPVQHGPRERFILYFSALEPRKGPRLAIRALAAAPADVRLVMVGDGPERHAIERLARRLGVIDRVDFRGRLNHPEIFELLGRCAAAVFCGLREEGGVALAEAMLAGTPVIVLGNGGARTIAESATDPSRVSIVEPGSVEETAGRMGEAMARFSRNPPLETSPLLDQDAARERLRVAVEAALGTAP
jgi:glycosyltransferase involved in cell wall biosynthesis